VHHVKEAKMTLGASLPIHLNSTIFLILYYSLTLPPCLLIPEKYLISLFIWISILPSSQNSWKCHMPLIPDNDEIGLDTMVVITTNTGQKEKVH
jgi:hypothetical protein